MKKIILLVTFIGLFFQSIAAKTLEGYENYKPQKVYVNVINVNDIAQHITLYDLKSVRR